jgi:hypothetical protein
MAVTSTNHPPQRQDYASNHRSRSWRLIIQTFHPFCVVAKADSQIVQRTADILHDTNMNVHVDLKVQLFEAQFDVDAMQELHVLANLLEVQRTAHELDCDVTIEEGNGDNVSIHKEPSLDKELAMGMKRRRAKEHEQDSQEIHPRKRERFADEEENKDLSEVGTLDLNMIAHDPPLRLGVASSSCDKYVDHESVLQRVNFIKIDYMRMAKARRDCARERALNHAHTNPDADSNVNTNTPEKWWKKALEHIVNDRHMYEVSLVQEVRDMLRQTGDLYRKKVNKISDAEELRSVLSDLVNGLETSREKAFKGMSRMSTDPSEAEVRENSQCKRFVCLQKRQAFVIPCL